MIHFLLSTWIMLISLSPGWLLSKSLTGFCGEHDCTCISAVSLLPTSAGGLIFKMSLNYLDQYIMNILLLPCSQDSWLLVHHFTLRFPSSERAHQQQAGADIIFPVRSYSKPTTYLILAFSDSRCWTTAYWMRKLLSLKSLPVNFGNFYLAS